ncbi:hypothetical protein [Spirosoma sp.]|uniref:hypothetical protein n=1 Tax=Spirosoma sp. TaxID=1899569 RepID=UPI00260A7FEA|nr:hypothetical protein [Spirosoma sp.]MCX6218325.1 hypothetical protein [Spirosoma sp.]
MNKDEWDLFWQAMPSAMKLFLGTFLGATCVFLRNKGVPIREGLSSAVIAIIAGYLLTLALCKAKGLDMGEWWFLGAGLAFIANFVLGGAETIGKQFQQTPIKVFIEWIMDTYDVIKARLKPK